MNVCCWQEHLGKDAKFVEERKDGSGGIEELGKKGKEGMREDGSYGAEIGRKDV